MTTSTCHGSGTCDHGTCCAWHCQPCQDEGTQNDLTKCEHEGCRAEFFLVPERQFPTLCLDHADDASRERDGWTLANSTD